MIINCLFFFTLHLYICISQMNTFAFQIYSPEELLSRHYINKIKQMRWDREAGWRWSHLTLHVSLKCGDKTTRESVEAKEKEKHERVSVAHPDRPSWAIYYSLNASQCQLYYCKAIPDWRPRVGGEKWLQNTARCPGRKTREGLWWMAVFDPGGVEGRDGSLPDETWSLQSPCPSAQSIPVLSGWEATR